MISEKLRSIFRREADPSRGSQLAAQAGGPPPSLSSTSLPVRRTAKKDAPMVRQSRGLEQFFFNIRDVVGHSILDCAGANQENIDFLINLGHKAYSPDLVCNP